MKSYRKDPSAVLDYHVEWSNWMETNDTISISTWTLDTGITNDLDAVADNVTSIWISGGTAGTSYYATNRIVTTAGRTNDETIVIRVENQ